MGFMLLAFVKNFFDDQQGSSGHNSKRTSRAQVNEEGDFSQHVDFFPYSPKKGSVCSHRGKVRGLLVSLEEERGSSTKIKKLRFSTKKAPPSTL